MNDPVSKKLKPCPICGAVAFLRRDIVDGFDFGFSVGCPRAKINDGIHGFNDYESFKKARLTMYCLTSKDEAINLWNKRASE